MKNLQLEHLFKQTTEYIKTFIDNMLRNSDITFSQFLLLEQLAANGGRLSQKELEKRLCVSHPTVVGLVARLTAKGFIKCSQDKNDCRQKIVSITKKGRRLAELSNQTKERFQDMLLEGVPEEYFVIFEKSLQMICANAKRMSDDYKTIIG